MTRLVTLLALAITGALTYDLVWGKGQDRDRATAVMRRTLELGESGLGRLSDELGRLRRGEYDQTLSAISARLRGDALPDDALSDDAEVWQQNYEAWLTNKQDAAIPEARLAEHAAKLQAQGEELAGH